MDVFPFYYLNLIFFKLSKCISNVPPLTDYFRSDEYKKEINLVNPFGCKGEIAEAYADLVNEMWSGKNSFTMPRNFKVILVYFFSYLLIYF